LAKISTYVIDGYIVDGDKVIGSDANNDMVTKNYTVGDLVAYFAASIGGNYLVPYIGANDDVDLGLFDITANDLITTNSIFAGGTEGLANQVLTSQGPGLPTIWAYNSGTQNLQSVLSNGNTANNSITLANASYSINLDQTTGAIALADLVNSRIGYINTSTVHLVGATSVADYYHNGVVYTSGANTISVLTNVFNNQTIRYPSAGGVLALSVNGVSADITGEITIPVGSAQNLQEVTDVGNVTTNPITIATQLNITQSGYTGSLSTFVNGLTGPTDWDLPNQSGTLVISVNGIAADSGGNINITSGGVSGSGTTNYIPKWSGSTSLSDSTIFDNGTSVGIGTATPNATYKLDVNGIIQTPSGINLSASSGVKTGIYSGSNQFTFWAGNNQLATYRLNGQAAGSFFEHTAGFTNTGATTGDQNVWRLAGSVTATTAVNTMNTNQLIINPTYNQQTFGTGILRGVYYNPTISNLNSSQHTAWENTSGNIIHGNLAGGGTQMVTVDNNGKLGATTIPSGASVGFEMNFLLMGA
jgi:hypothetical protein